VHLTKKNKKPQGSTDSHTDFSTSILLLFLFISLFSTTACKSVKTAQGVRLKVRSSEYLLEKLHAQNLEVEWLSAKARITFNDNGKSRKASANIRMRKDSVIWMNVKKLGVEGARILITPDSVYIVDRINKQYAITDFSFIENEYHLPANFKVLQNLILGNPLVFSESVLEAGISEDRYHLASDDEARMTSDYWMDGITYDLRKMAFLDYRYNRKVIIEQDRYELLEEKEKFSYFRSLDLSSPETGDLVIDLKLSKLEINTPKSIKFDIPDHYKKIE